MAVKVAASVRARRHLLVMARTDAAASEGMDGAVARARLYVEAGADLIFPEALHTAEMFREFARRLRAETGRDIPLTRQHDGVRPHAVLHGVRVRGDGLPRSSSGPSASMRVASRAQERLYAAIRRDGGTQNQLDDMQTRVELYSTIHYHDYEALDASLVRTITP